MQLKGQIFSIDFVIAMAVLTVVIGISVQTMDNMQKRALLIETSSSNYADVLAQNLITPSQGFSAPTSSWAYLYSNGSQSANYFTLVCPKHTFAATRVLTCIAGTTRSHCSLTVKSCS
ncbi:MAG: hypothetical protein ABIG96_04870 [Candidatus Micrarchaeota archaeon]